MALKSGAWELLSALEVDTSLPLLEEEVSHFCSVLQVQHQAAVVVAPRAHFW